MQIWVKNSKEKTRIALDNFSAYFNVIKLKYVILTVQKC
jgi:hypothetical protein